MAQINLSDTLVAQLQQIAQQRQGSLEDVLTRLVQQSTQHHNQYPFEILVESVGDMIFMLDTEQRHVGIWGKLFKEHGLEASYFLGKKAHEIQPPELAQIHEAANQHALDGEDVVYEWSIGEGEQRLYFQTTLAPIRDADGTITGIAGVGRDITAVRKAEESLWESELLNRSLIAALAEGVVFQLADGGIAISNPSAERILGLTADQMRGRTSLDPRWRAVHEDGSPFPGEGHPAMITLNTGVPQKNAIMGIHKPSGELTWISLNTEPMFHEGQATPYAVVVSFTDITAAKEIELKLRESEEIYRMVVEDQSEMVVRHTPDLTITFCNKAYAASRAMTLEQAMGSKLSDQNRDGVLHILTSLSPENPVSTVEFERQTADGLRWQEWTARAFFDEQGEPRAYQAVGRDIHDRRSAQQHAIELALHRERQNLLRHFIQDAAHEFRTPLSNINTSAYLLSRAKTPEDHQTYLQRVELHTQNIAMMVDEMMQMVGLESGVELARHPVNLNAIIREVRADLAQLIESKQHTLQLSLAPDLPEIRGDSTYLAVALGHIMQNACQFTPKGGSITISSRCADANAVITISDNGVGMPAEVQTHIFEHFYRADDARTSRGFGLGLPIAHKIIEQYGGSIEVESETGAGSTFTISLPLEFST